MRACKNINIQNSLPIMYEISKVLGALDKFYTKAGDQASLAQMTGSYEHGSSGTGRHAQALCHKHRQYAFIGY